MKPKFIHLLLLLLCMVSAWQSEIFAQGLTNEEKHELKTVMANDTFFANMFTNKEELEELYSGYKEFLMKDDSIWNIDQARLQKIKDFGFTKKFELIPVIDSIQSTGVGVSYLIRTDHATILFDTGYGPDTLKCTFRKNLDSLGIDIGEINTVFISHDHPDHQNEWIWVSNAAFIDKKGKNILPEIKVYVPEEIDYLKDLKIKTISSHDPVKIAEGVYSTGNIIEPTFMLGQVREQALMFNVKDKGIIIVTGCGHQTLEKIIQRVMKLTDANIYGLIGGLHLPFPNDKPFDSQFRFAGYTAPGILPWESINEIVNQNIELPKGKGIKVICLSQHDSSVKTLTAFRTAFPKEYVNLKIGMPVKID